MKQLIIILFYLTISLVTSAQNLLDIYKSGTVKLVPDEEYAKNNNWNDVFKTYYDTIYGAPMGNRKSLKLIPDGSVVINHQYRNFYSKFSPDGTFVKEFGVIGTNGKRFKKTNNIAGVINNNTFFTGLDNMGNMYCFDFNGNYKKKLILDYMSHGMVALPNGKIAVLGWVIWKTKFRSFVSLVDYRTNNEEVIWEHFTERKPIGEEGLFNYAYQFEKGGIISLRTLDINKTRGLRIRSKLSVIDDKLLLSNPNDGTIIVFDLEGNKLSETKISLPNNYISVDEQKAIQQKAIEKYSNKDPLRFSEILNTSEKDSKKAHEYFVNAMKEDLLKIKEPIRKPHFSTMMQDSDNNLLFFEFPEEENTNKFNVWVYKNGGEFVCQSSFVCDDFELQINPNKMVFKDGYIYGLQKLKNSNGVPLRLKRFKLEKAQQ